MNRAQLVTAASFAGNLGWGMILPFQYAYVVDARHWGSTAGVLTGTLFCLGAVVAAPLAGRLADRHSAGLLAAGWQAAAAVSCLALGAASSAWLFLIAMLAFGAAVTAAAPTLQVLILDNISASSRRVAFAYQFTAMALGMGAGAFVAGWYVDLDSPTGMWPAFALAAGGFALAAALSSDLVARLTGAADRSPYASASNPGGSQNASAARTGTPSGLESYRRLAAIPQVRLLAVVSVLLAAGFYAQFETGLPAFALQSLHVAPSTVGSAAAVNCVVIVGLQWLVVRLTGRQPGAGLLVMVGSIWALSWLMLEGAMFTGAGRAGAIFIVTFGVFAVGETMYSPVLGPLTATVAPADSIGATLGGLAALRTGVSAAGPLIAGLLISAGLSQVFVLAHVAINLAAALCAWRLLRSIRRSADATSAHLERGAPRDEAPGCGNPAWTGSGRSEAALSSAA